MKLNSLRTKFLAGFLPLFLGSFIVFFAISYYMSSQALFRNADTISQEIGKSTALEIEKMFQKKEMLVSELAHNHGIIYGDRAQRMKILADSKARSEGFAMLAYSDVNGQAYSETGKDMDRSSRDYIKKVRETKKPVMTGPSVSGSSGKLITIIAYPVLDGNELTGIVYGTIELDEISEIAGRIKYMETGRVFIADQDGLVIAYAQQPDDVGKLDLSKETSNKTIDKALVDGFANAVSQDKQIPVEMIDYWKVDNDTYKKNTTTADRDNHIHQDIMKKLKQYDDKKILIICGFGHLYPQYDRLLSAGAKKEKIPNAGKLFKRGAEGIEDSGDFKYPTSICHVWEKRSYFYAHTYPESIQADENINADVKTQWPVDTSNRFYNSQMKYCELFKSNILYKEK